MQARKVSGKTLGKPQNHWKCSHVASTDIHRVFDSEAKRSTNSATARQNCLRTVSEFWRADCRKDPSNLWHVASCSSTSTIVLTNVSRIMFCSTAIIARSAFEKFSAKYFPRPNSHHCPVAATRTNGWERPIFYSKLVYLISVLAPLAAALL